MGWAKIELGWSDDPAVKALSFEAKVLFVWSFTHNADASMTGLSEVSERKMRGVVANGKPATTEQLERVLAELGEKPLVRYDWDAELLWCVNRMKHVASESPFWRQGARRTLEKMPPSPLVTQFKRRYSSLLAQ